MTFFFFCTACSIVFKSRILHL